MNLMLAAALLIQEDVEEVRQKLKDARVQGSGKETLLSFALNLLSESAGYDIEVASDCEEAGNATAVLPDEEMTLDALLRRLLEPHKMTVILEDGKLVAVKRENLGRIVSFRYAPMASLMDEPPGGWPNAELAKALGEARELKVNNVEFGAALKLLAMSLDVEIAAGEGVDASKKVTIDSGNRGARDALRPVLDENGWTIVADHGRAAVVPLPAPPRGLESVVRDLMKLTVKPKAKATVGDVVDAASKASEMVIDVDEKYLKLEAKSRGTSAWEQLSSAGASQGLVPVYRGGKIVLTPKDEATGFVITSVRAAVDLLSEK